MIPVAAKCCLQLNQLHLTMNLPRTIQWAMPLAAAGLLLGAVTPGSAQVTEMLHETQDGTRDDYTGVIGTEFKVGSTNVVVSHLGIYDANGDGLALTHTAGLFTLGGASLLGTAAFAADSSAYFTNGVRWMPLDPPLLLAANTSYVLGADVISGSGDPFKDSYAPTNWNARFVGTNAASTRSTHYSAGGTSWPTYPASAFGSGTTYGNVTLGYIEVGKARAGVASTNIAVSVGQALNLVGFASGAPGITYQWYKSPSTLLTGKTNASFTIASAALTDAGTYYVTANNSLGSSQSALVTVSVTAYPVGIPQGPTNLTVLANYPATFSAVVTGSPPIVLQWLRNGAPIAGATSSSYSFTATSANNGDQYSLGASNNIAGTPYTALSASATLTVIPNVTQPQSVLHGAYPTTSSQNNSLYCVGGSFITPNRETWVTHLGYYAKNYTDATHATLVDNHAVYIFKTDYTTNAMVIVTAGVGLPVTNGYIWAALNPPVKLAASTTYILGADVTASDPGGNTYVVPDWSGYFTDTSKSGSFQAKYNNVGKCPYYGNYGGQMYSAPNMAILPVGSPWVTVTPTNVTQYAGLSCSVTAFVNGQAPTTAQWYKAPDTLLAGQTSLVLNFANPVVGDSGTYYLVASNSLTTAQSDNVSVTILPDVAPSITQDPQSQDVFVHSTVKFSVGVTGTPPLSYQWSFKGSPIAGATNSVYTVSDASSLNQGNYAVTVTNLYGGRVSASAALSVSGPAWGTYAASMMSPNLLAYYRFSDVDSGTGVAVNMGSLGQAYNGTYEPMTPYYSPMEGPENMSHFGAQNPAVLLDGYFGDVKFPAFGGSLSSATLAAWVYSAGGQVNDAAIYCHRGGGVFGLSVFGGDAVGGTNTLKYTWAGAQYNFQTGLMLPTNQWALVAVSVTPTRAIAYLQDGTGLKSATNTVTHGSVTCDSASYVGWDTAGSDIGRRWAGGIDEFMLFNRALSGVEVNALFLGVPGSATLTMTRSGQNLLLSWPGGTLQEADSLTGSWTSLPNATSPWPVSIAGPMKYYRVQLQP
jgi:hypothetical protein